jgi:hypothetical protein
MHAKVLDAILAELRPGQCLRDVMAYWGFRSTVPGPGLRQASEFLCRRHREHGLQAEVIAYPADDETPSIDGRKNPLAWVPRSARLEVAAPAERAGPLCTYAQEPLCLVCNSTATPAGGVEAPVVVMHAGKTDAEYEGVDVAGKIILTDDLPFLIEAQARRRGAIGIVSDAICPPWLRTLYKPEREPEDTPDLTLWSIFSGRRSEAGLWGFNLSPRQGRRLRAMLRESAEPVILRAEVDADLAPGTSEVVNALLCGTDLAHEEIWLLAHSSEPGAEDNASGCCMAVEVARTLKALVDRGMLPPLRRSIRFLNGVEVDGYLPYLQARREEWGHVVAALCFDAIGNDPSRCGGKMVLARTPASNPSFVDGLIEHLCRAVAEVPNARFTADTFALFPWEMREFLGNDAFISDGYFDIPTPQMTTWPERFYHSSQDTPDKLSENTLGRAGAIAAAYLYLLATAGPREAIWMAGLAAHDWKGRIADALRGEALADHAEPLDRRAAHLRALGAHLGHLAQDAIGRARDLAPDNAQVEEAVRQLSEDAARFAAAEGKAAVQIAAALAGKAAPAPSVPPSGPEIDSRGAQVWTRLRWEAPPDTAFSEAGRAALLALRARHGAVDRVWAWLNGRRNAQAAWERARWEDDLPWEVVAEYLELLAQEGLVQAKGNAGR